MDDPSHTEAMRDQPAEAVPYIPPGATSGPVINPADLYTKTTTMSFVAGVMGAPLLILLDVLFGLIGHVLWGPTGVLIGLAVGFWAFMLITARMGPSTFSYRRIRRPMLEQLGGYYRTDFAQDWRVGYARGKNRGFFADMSGDDSEDFGFLRLAPQQIEFYGVKTSFYIPRAVITETGLARCGKALFMSAVALCLANRRPFFSYRLPDGSVHSLNFECMDGFGWPGMMYKGRELAAELGRWMRSGTDSG